MERYDLSLLSDVIRYPFIYSNYSSSPCKHPLEVLYDEPTGRLALVFELMVRF